MSLYPLKFKPRFVEKIWGGRKIETVLHKKLPTPNPVGESVPVVTRNTYADFAPAPS